MMASRPPSFAPRHPLLALPFALVLALPAQAAAELDGEDFRIYCGYLDALEEPAVKKLKKPAQRDAKIARMAKLSAKRLREHVARGETHGATCDEVGKKVEAEAKAAVDKALPGRVDLFVLDYSDPSHVVAAVTWRGIDKTKLVEEAALLARVLADEAGIARTIAVRGVDPRAPDRGADEATWFEAKISRVRAERIDKAKISDYAQSRYLRLFDGVIQK